MNSLRSNSIDFGRFLHWFLGSPHEAEVFAVAGKWLGVLFSDYSLLFLVFYQLPSALADG